MIGTNTGNITINYVVNYPLPATEFVQQIVQQFQVLKHQFEEEVPKNQTVGGEIL